MVVGAEISPYGSVTKSSSSLQLRLMLSALVSALNRRLR